MQRSEAVKEKFIRYWSAKRGKGKTFYALKGALVWSSFNCFFIEVGMSLFEGNDYSFHFLKNITRLIIFFIMGYFYLRFNWDANEKRFQEIN
jgi:hypothetical protein